MNPRQLPSVYSELMQMLKFSETYLFKMHALTTLLDKVFDQTLRRHADITLSQFTLLLVVSEHNTVNQRAVARLLGVSPAAINRQVEIARQTELLQVKPDAEGRGHALSLSSAGRTTVASGIAALEQHVFQIFTDADRQTDLMAHLDILSRHAKTVAENSDTRQLIKHKM